jgi:CBS domain-containing protein
MDTMRKTVRPVPVSQIMKRDVGVITPRTTVRKAAQVMWAKRSTCVVVEKKRVPIGIITVSDILHAVAENQDLDVVTIEGVMSAPIIFVSPDTNIDWAAELMAKLHVSKLPVIENDRLLGLITEREITEILPNLVEMTPPMKSKTEEAFLVRHDGKLLARISKKESELDEDIVASMLTALEHFVAHSLTGKERGKFDELHYGDLKIVLRHGAGIMFAVFISGDVTDALLNSMDDVVNYVEAKYGEMLTAWDGDWTTLGDLQREIGGLMKL